MDVVLSVAALLVMLPVFALGALLIVASDGRPIWYVQDRAGLGGRRFRMYKFRSLRVHRRPAHQMAQVRSDSPLLTRVGAVLRRLKLDELPQLVNVLRGDMSLVGPRPALPEQVAAYDLLERRRLEVRPGITGWAQVNGNTELSWKERIWLDLWYIDHWSLALDLRILARTAGVVLRGDRVRQTALTRARAYADGTGRRG